MCSNVTTWEITQSTSLPKSLHISLFLLCFKELRVLQRNMENIVEKLWFSPVRDWPFVCVHTEFSMFRIKLGHKQCWTLSRKSLEWLIRVMVWFSSSLCRAEGTGVVLAGLQPHSDAVFVDDVGAAQWVAALWIHMFLAHQAEFKGPGRLTATWCCCCCYCPLWGRGRSLNGAWGRGSAYGPWGHPL